MKLLCLLLSVFALFNFNVTSVYATAEVYSQCKTDNVKFYKDSTIESFMFFLPKSYYVKVLNEGATFTHVECYGQNVLAPYIDGYILTADLQIVDNVPENPYLNFSIQTANSTNLYTDANFTSVVCHVFENRSLIYYGHAYDKTGNYIYYVFYNNRYGYVLESDIIPFTVPLHATFVSDEIPVTNTETNVVSTDKNVSVTLIICFCLSGLIIFASLIKPKQDRGANYEEN